MSRNIFKGISSIKMTKSIQDARDRVIIVAPAIFSNVAKGLIDTANRIGKENITVILDCDEEVFRLGYGDIEAIKLLESNEIEIRQTPGMRIGLFVCDTKAWIFSPVALYLEEDVHSDETPNAIEITGDLIDRLIDSIVPNQEKAFNDNDYECPEIGQLNVKSDKIQKIEKALDIAPPVAFDVARQVRVFEAYLQYVEINLKGCSIQRKRIKISPEIQGLETSEAFKEITDRLNTSFELIEKDKNVSSEELESELKKIRENFTRSLGKPWGRVILKSKRKDFDSCIKKFKEKLQEHKKSIEQDLGKYLKETKGKLIAYYLPFLKDNPPADLCGQIILPIPSEDDIKKWLYRKLDKLFPTPDQLTAKMKLEIQYRDITYETLQEDGFAEKLRQNYPFIKWDKPFDEFNAAKEKKTKCRIV